MQQHDSGPASACGGRMQIRRQANRQAVAVAQQELFVRES
jgi:hypothetical protein